VTLRDLFCLAYNVKSYQVTAPDWIASQRFDIIAKLPEGASKEDVPKMLQALLEDRFKLALHRESKDHPVLALVVGPGGPKMKKSPEAPKPIDADAPLKPGEKKIDGADGQVRTTDGKDGGFTMNMGAKGAVSYSVDPATRSMKIEASRMTMGEYATLLTTFSQATGGGQEVKDMTGLTGYYQVASQGNGRPGSACRSGWSGHAGQRGVRSWQHPCPVRASHGLEAGIAQGPGGTTGCRPHTEDPD
jgi:uncharacterized protein (TIGR03435 family)